MKKITELPLPQFFKDYYSKFPTLTPIQKKAVESGLLKNKSLLISAPTASGKTLTATMALIKAMEIGKKALYLVPLKALANEKFQEYQDLFEKTNYPSVRTPNSEFSFEKDDEDHEKDER